MLRFADEVCAATAERLAHAAAGRPGSLAPAQGSAGPAHMEDVAAASEELQPCVYFLPGAHPRGPGDVDMRLHLLRTAPQPAGCITNARLEALMSGLKLTGALPAHVAGRRGSDGVEQWGQVRVAAAFDSPDTLQSATAFLREYAADTDAHAACAVVPRGCIAFPQVLKCVSICDCLPAQTQACLRRCVAQSCKGGGHQHVCLCCCVCEAPSSLSAIKLPTVGRVAACHPPCFLSCASWLNIAWTRLHGVLPQG